MSLPEDAKHTPILDRDVLDKLAQMAPKPDFMEELIKGYIADAKKLIEDLKLAAGTLQRKELSDILHTMKSGAVHIGTSRLTEHITHLRNDIEQITGDQLDESIAEMETVFRETEKELLAYIE